MKHIAVDMDEVLAGLIDGFLAHHNYILNKVPCIKTDLHDYHISNISQLNLTKKAALHLLEKFICKADLTEIKPIDGAKEKLIEMKMQNYAISVVTARKIDLEKPTLQWLDHYFGNLYDKVVFCNYYDVGEGKKQLKGDVCIDIKADAIVEDNLDYAEEITSKGIRTYLLDNPWNKNYDAEKHKDIYKLSKREDLDIHTI